jgi:hypothetical protein
MNSKLVIFSLLVLAAACSKRIDLELPGYSSKIVVNGEANTDNTFSFQVSRSLPIMQSNDSTGYLLKNATVTVFDGNTPIGTATYQGGYYLLNQKPLPEHTYRVEVASPGYTTAKAIFTIPKALDVNTSYIDSIGVDDAGFKVSQITLSFTDEPGVKSYYRLLIRYYDEDILTWSPFNFTSNDILFLNNEKLGDGSYVFSDRTFSGKTKVLTFRVPFGLATGTPKFEVSMKTFSEDYYNYLRQTDEYNQNGNGLTNDPIILKTNVIDGLGMVGGVSNERDTIF